jgi:hypothetical protein
MKFDEDIDKKPILKVFLQKPLYEKKEGKSLVENFKDKMIKLHKTMEKILKDINLILNLLMIHYSKFILLFPV